MKVFFGVYLGKHMLAECSVAQLSDRFRRNSKGELADVCIDEGTIVVGDTLRIDPTKVVAYGVAPACKKIFGFVLEGDGRQFPCHVVRVQKKARVLEEQLVTLLRAGSWTVAPGDVVPRRSGCLDPLAVLDIVALPKSRDELQDIAIPRAALSVTHVIGQGQFGKVYLADYQLSKAAVKLLKSKRTDDMDSFLVEAATMLKFRGHDNIAQLIGVGLDGSPLLVVIEFLQYGDLHRCLTASRCRGLEWTDRERLCMAYQICLAMEHIASMRYIHIDLAARNCLVGPENHIKVSDFGLARPLDTGSSTHVMVKAPSNLPVRWMAVEACQKGVFSEKSDVWAFGVVMWEVWTMGLKPYSELKLSGLQSKVRDGHRLPRPERCALELFQALLAATWALHPAERPTFSELKALVADKAGVCPPADVHRDLGAASRLWFAGMGPPQLPVCSRRDVLERLDP